MAIENEQFEMLMMETMERTDKTVSVLTSEFAAIRAGRANPHILDRVLVDYYGTPTPLTKWVTFPLPKVEFQLSLLGMLLCLK